MSSDGGAHERPRAAERQRAASHRRLDAAGRSAVRSKFPQIGTTERTAQLPPGRRARAGCAPERRFSVLANSADFPEGDRPYVGGSGGKPCLKIARLTLEQSLHCEEFI